MLQLQIRDVVLKKIVYETVSGLTDFVRCYESDFLIMQEQKKTVLQKKELQAAKNQLEQAKRCVAEIDRIISRIYEDNISGKISDERFGRMSAAYEAEQKDLEKSIADCEEKLRVAGKAAIDLRMILNGLRDFSMVRELTPTIVNTLIQRIEIHSNDKSNEHCHVKVDIYFTAVGMIYIQTKQELERFRADYLKRIQSA